MIKKAKKIIFSSYDDVKNPYYGGGGAFAVHEVVKRLSKNFDVSVLTGNYPLAIKNEVIDGVKYERIGFSFVGPRLGQLIFHFLLMGKIMVRSFDVWIESFTPPFSTAFLPLFTSKPVIGLVHMLSGKDMRRKYFLPFDWIENVGLRVYKKFIVLSTISRGKINAINKSAQVSVVPNGVDVNAFYSQKKKAEYILFLGRIEVNQKGLDLLLEAYGLVQKGIKIPLLIAGSGTESETRKLNDLIRSLDLGDRVKLVGKIKGNKAKKKIFEKALFCVIPSRFETYSMVALESLASGTPLIVFDIDGLRWAPDKTVLRIPPFDIKFLAQKMLDLSCNADLREILVKEGRVFVSQYDWDNIANQYEEVIFKVIKK